MLSSYTNLKLFFLKKVWRFYQIRLIWTRLVRLPDFGSWWGESHPAIKEPISSKITQLKLLESERYIYIYLSCIFLELLGDIFIYKLLLSASGEV